MLQSSPLQMATEFGGGGGQGSQVVGEHPTIGVGETHKLLHRFWPFGQASAASPNAPVPPKPVAFAPPVPARPASVDFGQ